MAKPGEPSELGAGEDGYVADDFSRNDREGRPSPEEAAGGEEGRAAARSRKATDDADSRDAAPPQPQREGGVR
jgi:hypothetical protein